MSSQENPFLALVSSATTAGSPAQDADNGPKVSNQLQQDSQIASNKQHSEVIGFMDSVTGISTTQADAMSGTTEGLPGKAPSVANERLNIENVGGSNCQIDLSSAVNGTAIDFVDIIETSLEFVLRLSVRPGREKCLFLQGMAESKARLTLNRINEAVFERLMMEPSDLTANRCDPRHVMYLYGCYQRTFKPELQLDSDTRQQVRLVLVEQAATCLMNEPIYPGPPDPPHNEQLQMLVMDERSLHISEFLCDLSVIVQHRFDTGGEEVPLQDIIKPSLVAIEKALVSERLPSPHLRRLFDRARMFMQNEPLVVALFAAQTPKPPRVQGSSVNRNDASLGLMQEVLEVGQLESSLLGALFNRSPLGHEGNNGQGWGFFERMVMATVQDVALEEQNLWVAVRRIQSELFEIVNQMLRISHRVRGLVVEWFGYALELCSSRSKLGGVKAGQLSHGFAMNLVAVLLRLAQPFCRAAPGELDRVLRADFTYCAWPYDGDRIRLRDCNNDTTLLPRRTIEGLEKHVNFPTECYFAVHKALLMSTRVIHERLMDLNKEIARLREMYEEERLYQFRQRGPEVIEMLENQLNTYSCWYHCLRTVVFEPYLYDMLLNVTVASAHWLVEVATREEWAGPSCSGMGLSRQLPPVERLSLVPEYILENISDTLVMTERFSDRLLSQYWPHLSVLLRLITTFMGSAERVSNPHMRAKLARMLEVLLVTTEADETSRSISGAAARAILETPVSDSLSATLIEVFVSIEMTGQSVSFEEKFQYRRPMYLVLEQLWQLPKHRIHMEQLSEEAIRNIEDSSQPIFLRFANLLINDANFLVYESFQYMQRLKTLERERASWEDLPFERRQQNEGNFQHQAMIARFHNVMARETIRTLTWLTSSPTVRRLFLHPVLIDRIAVMLNFFLLHLVGPDHQKNLRVQNLQEYEFRPALLVESIAQTYLNLASGVGARRSEEHIDASVDSNSMEVLNSSEVSSCTASSGVNSTASTTPSSSTPLSPSSLLSGNPASLSSSSDSREFCEALVRDERSYKAELFVEAQKVLNKIGRGVLGVEMEELGRRVAEVQRALTRQEELTQDAPEDFMDPLMFTLMTDPVVLPTSGVTVDRNTIARHLLSDQTDPFNRQPLSLEQVRPNDELRHKIEQWLKSIGKQP